MRVILVEKEEYLKAFKNTNLIFNHAEFIETNSEKVQKILYLLIYKNNSVRFAVAFGIREGGDLYCPFSAPFAYIEPIKSGMGIQDYEEAVEALDTYFLEVGVCKVTMVFPPEFYDRRSISAWIQIFSRNRWKCDNIDINFAFNLSEVGKDYVEKIARNARKNLKIALESNLKIKECVSVEEKRDAYRIIKLNRDSKGYPLRMTEEQVLKTIQIVPSTMFIVSCGEENLAAALVYEVTKTIAQVVYWGDIPGHPEKKVINYLAYELIKKYVNKGFDYLDIGPSTEQGVPNYGLCDFKDGIGCERSLKFKLSKDYRESN